MDSVYVIEQFNIESRNGKAYLESVYTWTIHKTESGARDMLKALAAARGFAMDNEDRTQIRTTETGESYLTITKQKIFN